MGRPNIGKTVPDSSTITLKQNVCSFQGGICPEKCQLDLTGWMHPEKFLARGRGWELWWPDGPLL